MPSQDIHVLYEGIWLVGFTILWPSPGLRKEKTIIFICNTSAASPKKVPISGADPGFFLGVACTCTRLLLYVNTNKPHSFQEGGELRAQSSELRRGVLPLHPPPRSPLHLMGHNNSVKEAKLSCEESIQAVKLEIRNEVHKLAKQIAINLNSKLSSEFKALRTKLHRQRSQ